MDTEIPEGDEVLIVSPGGDTTAFDLYTLTKAWVLTGKLENPLTRQALPHSEIVRVISYKRIRVVLPTLETVYVSGVAPVWLAIATLISQACGSVLDCLQFDIVVGNVSLYSYDMSVDLSDVIQGESVSVLLRPHSNFVRLRTFACALSSQQELVYKETAREIKAHLRSGSVIQTNTV